MDQDNQFNAVPEEGVPAPALDAQTVKYLLFCSDNLLFGVSADYVVEIITNHAITKLPLVPNYIRGIINLRGQIIPIVDIRLLLGQPSQSDNCIIILNIEDTLVGILVDTVQKMIDVDTALILPSPSQDTRNLVSGMCSLFLGQRTHAGIWFPACVLCPRNRPCWSLTVLKFSTSLRAESAGSCFEYAVSRYVRFRR